MSPFLLFCRPVALPASATRPQYRLKHPHIATVFEVGQTGSQAFVVMEYLAGGALKEHIRSMNSVGDVFPVEQILAYAEQIALAVKHAQDEGILHGNLKAENVMFAGDSTLKLTDFNAQNDASTDLQAFGKVLYEMATGDCQFQSWVRRQSGC